jgi:hypothetical protein
MFHQIHQMLKFLKQTLKILVQSVLQVKYQDCAWAVSVKFYRVQLGLHVYHIQSNKYLKQ